MKLSCLPVSYFGQIIDGTMSVGQWAHEAAEIGLDAVDLSILFVNDQDPGQWEALRQEIESAGMAVAMVTMNRVKSRHYPNSVCSVVWQRKQFSWTHDGKSDRPTDAYAWKLAQKIARFAYQRYGKLTERTRKALDLTKGALHYYAPKLTLPYWAKAHSVTREIGGHIFMTGRS